MKIVARSSLSTLRKIILGLQDPCEETAVLGPKVAAKGVGVHLPPPVFRRRSAADKSHSCWGDSPPGGPCTRPAASGETFPGLKKPSWGKLGNASAAPCCFAGPKRTFAANRQASDASSRPGWGRGLSWLTLQADAPWRLCGWLRHSPWELPSSGRLSFLFLSVWTVWLIPILGALVLGLMYRYCVMDSRSS